MGGCLYEPCFALVTRNRGAAAKRSITLIALAAGFAGTIAFPTVHLIAEASDWRWACACFALLVCLIAAPLLYIGARRLESTRPAADPRLEGEPQQPAGALIRRPEFWLLAGGFSAFALNHGILLNHILPILHERGLDAGTAVFAASMIGPMQVAGRLVMMAAGRHASNKAVTIACFAAVLGAALLLIAATKVPVLVVGFVILQGSGYGVTSVMRPVVTRDILGATNFGLIAGALAVPYLAAVAIAPFLGALLWQIGGYRLAIETAFAVAGLGLAFYLRATTFATRRPGRDII
jgi:MFS family permease